MKKLYLLFLFFCCGLFLFGQVSISVDGVSVDEIQPGGAPVFMRIKITNTTASTISDSLLLDLPSGIWYEKETMVKNAGDGTLGGHNISDLNQPKFFVELAGTKSIVLDFKVKANCNFSASNPFVFTYSGVSTTEYYMNAIISYIAVSNIAAVSGYSQTSFDRDFTISQGNSNAIVNQLFVKDTYGVGMSVDTMVVLDASNNPVAGGSYNAVTGIFTIDSTALYNATGYKYLSSSAPLTVRESITLQCPNPGNLSDAVSVSSEIDVYNGTINPTDSSFVICSNVEKVTSVTLYNTGSSVPLSWKVIQKVGLNQSMIVEFTSINAKDEPAFDLVYPIGMSLSASFGYQRNERWANHYWTLDSVVVQGVRINTNDEFVFAEGTSAASNLKDWAWTAVFDSLTSDPDGVGKGLDDIDGDGYYGDLLPRDTARMRVYLHYDPTYFYTTLKDSTYTPFCKDELYPDNAYQGGNNILKLGTQHANPCGKKTYTRSYNNVPTFSMYNVSLLCGAVDLNLRDGASIGFTFGITAEALQLENSVFYENGGKVIKVFTFPRELNVSDLTYSDGSAITAEEYTITDSTVVIVDTADTYLQKQYMVKVTPNCSSPTYSIYHKMSSMMRLAPGPSIVCDTLDCAYRESDFTLNVLCPGSGTPTPGTAYVKLDTFMINRTSFGFLDADEDDQADDNVTLANANTPDVNLQGARNFQTVDFTMSAIILATGKIPTSEILYTMTDLTTTDTLNPYFTIDSITVEVANVGGSNALTLTDASYFSHKRSGWECTMSSDSNAVKEFENQYSALAVDDTLRIIFHTTTSEDLPYPGASGIIHGNWCIESNVVRKWLKWFYLEDVNSDSFDSRRCWNNSYCVNTFRIRNTVYDYKNNQSLFDKFPHEVFGVNILNATTKVRGYWSMVDTTETYYFNGAETVGVHKDNLNIKADTAYIDGDLYSTFSFENSGGNTWIIGDGMNHQFVGLNPFVRADCPNLGTDYAVMVKSDMDFVMYSYAIPAHRDTIKIRDHYSYSGTSNGSYHPMQKISIDSIAPNYCTAMIDSAALDVTYGAYETDGTTPCAVSNAWMIIRNSDGLSIPTSVIELDASGDPTSTKYSLTRLGTKNEWYVFVGDLVGGKHNFRIMADHITCGGQLDVVIGYNCDLVPELKGDSLVYPLVYNSAYSTSDTLLYYSIEEFNTESTTLTIGCNNINLSGRITCLNGDTVTFCDSVEYNYTVQNLAGDRAYNNEVTLAPASNMAYVSGSSYVVFDGTTYTLPDPDTLGTGELHWDIDTVSALGHVGDDIDYKYVLGYKLQNICGFVSESRFSMKAFATTGCGDADETKSYSPSVIIYGSPNTDNHYFITSNISALTPGVDSAEITIQFSTVAANVSPPGTNEYLDLVVPTNITYLDNYNNIYGASPAYLSDDVHGAERTIRFQFDGNIALGDNATFSFNIGVSDASLYECPDTINFDVKSIISSTGVSSCNGETCATLATTASIEDTLFIFKQDVEIDTITMANSVLNTAGGEDLTIDYVLQNNEVNAYDDTLLIMLVVDADADGEYDNGETILTTQEIATAIAASGTLDTSMTVSVLDVSDMCSLLLTLVTDSNSYVCASSAFAVDSIGVIEGGAGDDAIFCEGDAIQIGDTCSATTGYTYEWVYVEGGNTQEYLSAYDVKQPTFEYPGAALTDTMALTYKVTLTRACGLSSVDTMLISLQPKATDPSGSDTLVFCESENPTIADLSAIIDAGDTLLWYNDSVGGVSMVGTFALENDSIYYAEAWKASPGSCPSDSRFAVTAIINETPNAGNDTTVEITNVLQADLDTIISGNPDTTGIWYYTGDWVTILTDGIYTVGTDATGKYAYVVNNPPCDPDTAYVIISSDSEIPQLIGPLPAGESGINSCADSFAIEALITRTTAAEADSIKKVYVDNVSAVTVTYDSALVSSDNCSWTFDRYYTVSDESANDTSVIIAYSGGDLEQPILLQPTDRMVYRDAANQIASADTLPDATGTGYLLSLSDNCSDSASMTVVHYDEEGGKTVCGDSILRKWYAVDLCGNVSDTATQIIFVADSVAPEFTLLPSNDTVECDTTTNAAAYSNWLANHAGATATSADTVIWSYSDSVFVADCGKAGYYGVMFYISDKCGNQDSAAARFVIVDTKVPQLTGTLPTGETDINTCADESGIGALILSTASESDSIAKEYSDNSGSVIVTYDSLQLNGTSCVWTFERYYTVSDECGNDTSVVIAYSGYDQEKPTLTPPADMVVYKNSSNGITVTDTIPDATGSGYLLSLSDNCSDSASMTVVHYDDLSGITTCGGNILRNWYATDVCGNVSDTVIQTITVLDSVAPEFTLLPSNDTVECDTTTNAAAYNNWLANHAGATATSADTVIWSYSDSVFVADCGKTGYYGVMFYISDKCGNQDSAAARFVIVDTKVPQLTGTLPLGDTDVNACADESGINALILSTTSEEDSIAKVYTDKSGTVLVTYDSQQLSGTNCAWTLDRNYIVSDECGNDTSVIISYSGYDQEKPTFTVPVDVMVYKDENGDILSADTIATVSGAGYPSDLSDNCSALGDISVIHYDDLSVLTACGGNIERHWYAIDLCGNVSDTLIQMISVRDNVAPVITTDAANDTVEYDGSGNATEYAAWLAIYGGAIATSADTVIWTYTEGEFVYDCGETGSREVTFYASDECSNADSTIAYFVTEDNTTPVISCPSDTTISCKEDTASANTGLATATDASAVNIYYEDEVPSNTDVVFYTIKRKWFVVDECGNTDNCTQLINISKVFTLEDDSCTTEFETAVSGDASKNDSMTTGGVYEIYADASKGSAYITDNGVFTYTPEDDYSGNDSFTYMVTDGCGEEKTAVVYVRVEAKLADSIFVPNLFSPNGDGVHDLFQIKYIDDYPDAHLWVYNRWGKLVYEQENYGNPDLWDGSSNQSGTLGSGTLPSATYFYVIDLGDGQDPIRGYIYLYGE